MSTRDYFSLRYGVTGFTFILIIISLNYYPIIQVLKSNDAVGDFGLVLSFLSLFASSAIGFFVAQFFFFKFHWRRSYLKIFEKSDDALEARFDWKKKSRRKGSRIKKSSLT